MERYINPQEYKKTLFVTPRIVDNVPDRPRQAFVVKYMKREPPQIQKPFTNFSSVFKNCCEFVHYIVIICCYIMLTAVRKGNPPEHGKKHDA